MGRLSALLLALVLAAAATLGLAACGEESADLLPGATASEISSNLDQVRDLVGEGECIGAADAAEEVSAQIEALNGVDARLKAALREGAARLNEVVASCEEAPEEETEPAVETAIEPEAEEEEKEKPQKPDKAKPGEEAEEAPEEKETEPSLPPQAEGKAKGHEKQEEAEAPPATDGGTSAGGIAPSEEAAGE